MGTEQTDIDVRSGYKGLYQTTLYPGVLLDAASDLKFLASERGNVNATVIF